LFDPDANRLTEQLSEMEMIDKLVKIGSGCVDTVLTPTLVTFFLPQPERNAKGFSIPLKGM